MPTLATTTLTIQSSHQFDEDFISKSLLDSLDAQADAEPPHSAIDSDSQGPSSFNALSDTSSTSSSIAYPISLHSQHRHLLRSDSPSDRNQHILNQLQDSSFGLYSHSSNMNIQPDFTNEFETTKLQQHAGKLNGFGPNNNFRASFTAIPNNNRPHPSSFRETHNYMQPDVYPPQMTSPMGSYDSHASFDYGHPQPGHGGPKHFMGDYNANAASLLSHHNNPKANGPMGQQQSHGKYPNAHAFSGGVQLTSQTPYGPHIPAGALGNNPPVPAPAPQPAVGNANTQSASNNQEEICTIFVVGFPEDMQVCGFDSSGARSSY